MNEYRRPTFKCEDAICANANFFPDSQLLNSQLTYYVCGDKSRRAQNAIIEFTISLKTLVVVVVVVCVCVCVCFTLLQYTCALYIVTHSIPPFPGQKGELDISTYGVSVTTMEEVFIKVGIGVEETLERRYSQWVAFV